MYTHIRKHIFINVSKRPEGNFEIYPSYLETTAYEVNLATSDKAAETANLILCVS
jgi:hypothetical protein